ncbi:nickel-dependent hydrogenase large subunit [Collinsella tanakaei]|uniref:nickel-dependent hydrogenase large subunit n=1 Tax=Collinsella tanakaei TaxID=626935 RepID=UPI00195A5ABD|nr:nickel-dependent hydrogenase large subunit [Collinsella tanakaei]MBM6755771.1 nickel-dependent hydrogenase large subunit [Collinsella tanakaei]MBM6868971.1 nickel-dependent hydrogenase large subunit [Collinsella tanakaei]
MARSIVDPITRVEGHLSIEMEVEDGKVSQAWVSGNLYRGLEHALEGRSPYDAALISQRVCGVCPVSHVHASCLAAEDAYGIQIPDGARLVRNLAEGGQILHSTILWFYNLMGLDYINPLNALGAKVADAYDVCEQYGTSGADFTALSERLQAFADNGQLSIFSGNWFDAKDASGAPAYHFDPAEDLVGTAHYFEGLEKQGEASQICALIGGKMPHIMTSIPGGTSFMPTPEKIDGIIYRIKSLKTWIDATMIPDAFMILAKYPELVDLGQGPGRFISFGVLESANRELYDRYLPAGMSYLRPNGSLGIDYVDVSLITEDVSRAYYAYHAPLNPLVGRTDPQWPEDGRNVDHKYTWCKAARYDGETYEAGGIARMVAAYQRGVEPVGKLMDSALKRSGIPWAKLDGVAGRILTRVLEASYVADKMAEDAQELVDLMAAGEAEYYTPATNTTGEGVGLWEAPRGALLHTERVENDTVTHYQEIIPSTWNLSPTDGQGNPGPLEEMLVGTDVTDLEKPLDAVRIVHSVDPCTACACHVSEPASGKTFSTVTSPWGVR